MNQRLLSGGPWLALIAVAGCQCGSHTQAPLLLQLPDASVDSGVNVSMAGRTSSSPPASGRGAEPPVDAEPQAGRGPRGGGVAARPAPACADAGTDADCDCPPGFAPASQRDCVDVDECAIGLAQCSTLASCENLPGTYRCGTCAPGYDDVFGDGSECREIDECALQHGGCSPLTECIDLVASALCGPCPEDYVAIGRSGCAPTLIGLLTVPALAQDFYPSVHDYDVTVPLLTPTVTLTPTAAAGASLTINDSSVTSGSAWISPELAPGSTLLSIAVRRGSEPEGSYRVRVARGSETYVKADNTSTGAAFGQRVALSADTLVVGAESEGGAGSASGAVYVFVREGSGWRQQAYLSASNRGAGDYFGSSVAIDGDLLVVGARGEAGAGRGVDPAVDDGAADAGAAYVFVRDGESWTQQAYLKASNAEAGDRFGLAVAVHGQMIAVGAPFEASSARMVGGDENDNAAPSSGAVYLFEQVSASWTQVAYLKAANADAGDGFGASVALADGTLAVAAPLEDGGSPGVNGDAADNSQDSSGAVYVFRRDSAVWAQEAYLKANYPGGADTSSQYGDQFGGGEQFGGPGIAISGDTLAVGAAGDDSAAAGVNGDASNNDGRDVGAVHVFTRSAGGVWGLQAYLKASNPVGNSFGHSVGISGDALVVGAFQEHSSAVGIGGDESDESALRSGAAYVFVRDGQGWSQLAYVKASNTESDDFFGWSVAISEAAVAVGAPGEDSLATGIDGDQTSDAAPGSGAAYLVY